jgi:pimeloyl-ACP methyl ester carboxylesterase
LKFAHKLAVAAILLLTCGEVAAQPLLRVYAIRGFAGVVFSRGMNQLCDELASIPRIACTVNDFFEEAKIEGDASAAMAAGQRLIIVGHSLGAHAALRIAAAMKGAIPLVVTIDPNWFPTPPAVPQNALVVLNYYQDFDVLGRATLQTPPAFRGQLHQFRRSEAHVLIDRSPDIHAEIVARIRNILASMPSRGHAVPPSDFDRRRR